MNVSRSFVRAIALRPAALLLPYAPPPAPPLPGPTRWSSSIAGQLASTDLNEKPASQVERPGQDLPESSSKGKTRAEDDDDDEGIRRSKLIKDIMETSPIDIEESSRWKNLDARYPGMKSGQVRLMAVLLEMMERSSVAGVHGLSAKEVSRAHTTLLASDQEEVRRDGNAIGRRYLKSSATYTMMLKYAYKLRDAPALRLIAKEALSWKDSQDRVISPSRTNKKNRFTHPRMVAADDLSRLARNLFVSLKVKHKQEASKGTETFLPGKELPSSKLKVIQGDDAIALSTLLQNRLGTFKFAKGDQDEQYLKLSRPALLSRYPLTHQSRRIRWINRMVEKGILERIVEGEGINADAMIASTSARKSINDQILENKDDGAKEMLKLLTKSSKGAKQKMQLEALKDGYKRWQEELRTRLGSRKNVSMVLKQFKFTANTSTENKVEAISQVVPTWLVLSSLRMQIYVGDSFNAERIVELYLESLQKVHGDRLLSDVIPVHQKRIHSVTDPFSPPLGSSLLNGMLRAHSTGATQDCFEEMLEIVERWCVNGWKLCTTINQRKTFLPKVRMGNCLVPNDKTLSILLDSLRSRRKRLSLGIKLVEEMCKRWAVNKSEGDHTKSQTLNLSLQTFTTLLTWAVVDGKVERVDKVLAMRKRWIENHFQEKEDHDRWYGATPKERISWEKAKEKADVLQKKRSKQGEEGKQI